MFVSETSPAFRVQRRSLLSECELCPRGLKVLLRLGVGAGELFPARWVKWNQAHLPAGVDLSYGEYACAHTEALRSVAAQHWFG